MGVRLLIAIRKIITASYGQIELSVSAVASRVRQPSSHDMESRWVIQNPEIAIFMEYVRFLNTHKLALSGLVKGPKPLINSLRPIIGAFQLA
ncbi:hypothetical protein EKTHUN627_20270 [Enterobacter kobei]|nr:hypothetical protein EKTHUN627_20270 [Enterobacter kobei]